MKAVKIDKISVNVRKTIRHIISSIIIQCKYCIQLHTNEAPRLRL